MSYVYRRPFDYASRRQRVFSRFFLGSASPASLSAAGSGTAAFVGQAIATGVLSVAGAASASFITGFAGLGELTASGLGLANFVGASLVQSTLSVSGTSTASFAGGIFEASKVLQGTRRSIVPYLRVRSAVYKIQNERIIEFTVANNTTGFAIAGTSTANFTGQSLATSQLISVGQSTVSFVGQSGGQSVLTSAGTSSALFVSSAAGVASLAATGTSSFNPVGQAIASASLFSSAIAQVQFRPVGFTGGSTGQWRTLWQPIWRQEWDKNRNDT